MLALALFNPGEVVEIRDFAGDLDRDFIGIKMGDAAHTAFSGENCVGECSVAHSIGADHTHACDYDSSIHAHPLSLENYTRVQCRLDAFAQRRSTNKKALTR